MLGLVPGAGLLDKRRMAERVIDLLGRAGRGAVAYALPPRCPGCGVIVAVDHSFCADCWGEMRFLSEPCCASCGLPFDFEEAEDVRCAACLDTPPPWTTARAALAYGPVSSHIAMRLKYGRRTVLSRLMARHMASRISADIIAMKDNALLIPVPLHRWRIWGRGFNQAALLAREIGKITGLAHDPLLLQRQHATRPLKDLGPREREREVRQAFEIDLKRRDALQGKTIILVDDIHTSGATARACTRKLLDGGAEAVHLLCWARVL
jgi:ComF family protein